MTAEIERDYLKSEYISIPLPIIEYKSEKDELIINVLLKIKSIITKQIILSANSKKPTLNRDLEKVLKSLWNEAYSEGLKHMDKMHGKIDNL